jgi:hypothetical protein
MKKNKLSIVILSYNTKELTLNCLESVMKVKSEVDLEVIVPDNSSVDGSVEAIRQQFPKVTVIENKANLGFAAGNNVAQTKVSGEYILFLNSDTIVYPNVLKETTKYLDDNPKVGVITCKVVLPNGELDKDTRRSFVTPWIGLTHIFLKLDRFFPTSKLFAKYWYGYLSSDVIHEVDAIQGAFFLTRKSVLDKVGWWDADYFLDGEDIDLCFRIHELGYKIIYYPKVKITHYRGASKGKTNKARNVPLSEKLKFRMAGVNSQEIFYRKHLWSRYPLVLNLFVIIGIRLLKLLRIVKTVVLG